MRRCPSRPKYFPCLQRPLGGGEVGHLQVPGRQAALAPPAGRCCSVWATALGMPFFQAARKAIQDVLERKLEESGEDVSFCHQCANSGSKSPSQDLKFDLSSSKELRACIELLKCNGLGPELLPTSLGTCRVLRERAVELRALQAFAKRTRPTSCGAATGRCKIFCRVFCNRRLSDTSVKPCTLNLNP